MVPEGGVAPDAGEVTVGKEDDTDAVADGVEVDEEDEKPGNTVVDSAAEEDGSIDVVAGADDSSDVVVDDGRMEETPLEEVDDCGGRVGTAVDEVVAAVEGKGREMESEDARLSRARAALIPPQMTASSGPRDLIDTNE